MVLAGRRGRREPGLEVELQALAEVVIRPQDVLRARGRSGAGRLRELRGFGEQARGVGQRGAQDERRDERGVALRPVRQQRGALQRTGQREHRAEGVSRLQRIRALRAARREAVRPGRRGEEHLSAVAELGRIAEDVLEAGPDVGRAAGEGTAAARARRARRRQIELERRHRRPDADERLRVGDAVAAAVGGRVLVPGFDQHVVRANDTDRVRHRWPGDDRRERRARVAGAQRRADRARRRGAGRGGGLGEGRGGGEHDGERGGQGTDHFAGTPCASSARLSSRTLTRGSPRMPNWRGVTCAAICARTASSARPRTLATRAAW
ncbi:MAG: hypothetical protein QOI11_2943 [Candidatus Eremiobacteraeota bacterium]|nr:hypothetical protein [Candidatus Eremiobacteraeota bacterium]